MKGKNSTNPTPPPVPSVDRETGKVTMPRPEDVGKLDGWEFSDEPDSVFDMGPDVSRPNHAERKQAEKSGKGLHEVAPFSSSN